MAAEADDAAKADVASNSSARESEAPRRSFAFIAFAWERYFLCAVSGLA